MDSEFLPNQNYVLHPETWSIDRIVLFANRSSAELYLERIFPLNCNCIVASADHTYPQHRQLANLVFKALSEDRTLRVAIFNASLLKSVSVVTERLLIMDDLVSQDFKHHPAERPAHLNLTPERISFLVHQFFNQWDKLARLGNSEFALRNFSEFKNLDWRADLIASPTGKPEHE
jgi:hypothetical protein